MKGFFALTVVTFWLTAFPLKGPLLQDPSLFLLFLFFHGIGFFSYYFLYSRITNMKIVIASLIITSSLTILFPFLSLIYQKLCISLIGFFSPPWVIYVLSFLKIEFNLLWPYSGLIFGNLLTYLLSLISSELNWISYVGLGLLLLFIFMIKKNHKVALNWQIIELKLSNYDYFFLYSAIFLYYFISPFFYEIKSIEHEIDYVKDVHIYLIFYSLGILSTFYLLKYTKINIKDIFILTSSLLTLANSFFILKTKSAYVFGKSTLFFSCGIMDFITLYLFINFFNDMRNLILFFVLILTSLLISNLLFINITISGDHLFIYLGIISLLCILFFYKLNLKFIPYIQDLSYPKKEEQIAIDSQITTDLKVSPDTICEKINQKLDSATKKLSKRECEVIYYYIFENKNLTEIAQILEISRSSVKEYLKRACIKLGTNQYELKSLLDELLRK